MHAYTVTAFSVHVYIVHGYVGVFCFCCVCVCVCLGGWGGGVFLNRIYISFICVVPTFSCLLHFVVAFLWKQMGGRLDACGHARRWKSDEFSWLI